MNEKEKIVAYLKDTILKNGITYLNDDAFEVYEDLKIKNGIRTAILSCLLNGVCKFSSKKEVKYDELLSYIKDNCLLNEETTSYMADIFIEVFSDEYKKEYDAKKGIGFDAFCDEIYEMEWDGFSRWYMGSVHLDCTFRAKISFKVIDKEKVKNDNLDLIKKNPYLTSDFFYTKYKDEITRKLDADFEDYCTCDKYYEPNAEDYGIESGEYELEQYCNEHGLELIEFEGEGETSDYER